MNAELPLDEQVEGDAKPIDAVKLRALLRRKYPADQYAMLYEVRDAAGFSAKRSADVMLIGRQRSGESAPRCCVPEILARASYLHRVST